MNIFRIFRLSAVLSLSLTVGAWYACLSMCGSIKDVPIPINKSVGISHVWDPICFFALTFLALYTWNLRDTEKLTLRSAVHEAIYFVVTLGFILGIIATFAGGWIGAVIIPMFVLLLMLFSASVIILIYQLVRCLSSR